MPAYHFPIRNLYLYMFKCRGWIYVPCSIKMFTLHTMIIHSYNPNYYSLISLIRRKSLLSFKWPISKSLKSSDHFFICIFSWYELTSGFLSALPGGPDRKHEQMNFVLFCCINKAFKVWKLPPWVVFIWISSPPAIQLQSMPSLHWQFPTGQFRIQHLFTA